MRVLSVAVPLFTILACLAGMELVLRLSEPPPNLGDRGEVVTYNPPLIRSDPELGFRLAPGKSRHVITRDGVPVWDVVYTIDERGFRVTPAPEEGPAILVLGDSYHFGDGINDSETLAAALGRRGFHAVNMAAPGYGPHQVLRQIEIGEIERSAIGPFKIALLSLCDDHIYRMRGKRSWSIGGPRYEISATGALVRRGNFQEENSTVKSLRVVTRASQLFEPSDADDIVLLESILARIATSLEERHGARLVVLYHSGSAYHGAPEGRRQEIIPMLQRLGRQFIDVNAELDTTSQRDLYFIAGDGHPAPALNEAIARKAVERMASH